MGRPKGSKNKPKLAALMAPKLQREKAIAKFMIVDGADPNVATEQRVRKPDAECGRKVKVRDGVWCFIRLSLGGKLALVKRYAYRHWDVEWVPASIIKEIE